MIATKNRVFQHGVIGRLLGKIILEARTPTAPKTIAAALAKGPSVDRVLFETGRMAPDALSWSDGAGLAGGLR